jgi:hypothetical protein
MKDKAIMIILCIGISFFLISASNGAWQKELCVKGEIRTGNWSLPPDPTVDETPMLQTNPASVTQPAPDDTSSEETNEESKQDKNSEPKSDITSEPSSESVFTAEPSTNSQQYLENEDDETEETEETDMFPKEEAKSEADLEAEPEFPINDQESEASSTSLP